MGLTDQPQEANTMELTEEECISAMFNPTELMLINMSNIADNPSLRLIHDPEPFTFEEASSIPWMMTGVCLETHDGLKNVIFWNYAGNSLPQDSHLGEWYILLVRDRQLHEFKGKDYGKTWRLWAREPTPEQLAAHPWAPMEES